MSRQAEPKRRQAYEPLDWYASRGLLARAGESEALGHRRYEAGQTLQRWVERGLMRPKVTQSLNPLGPGPSRVLATDWESLPQAIVAARAQVERGLRVLPVETRDVAQEVLIHRRFAGSAQRLDLLRRALDALYDFYTKRNKSIDARQAGGYKK